MCLGSLYHSAPDEIVFLSTREAYEPYCVDTHHKYFDANTFYSECAKPWNQRRLPMRHEPRDDAVDVALARTQRWRTRGPGWSVNRRMAGLIDLSRRDSAGP